ncbi:hypothetical protein FACS189451_03270 [Bacteroidia bacterium]|nr:hypothetical protein FACS189451_03270 [Bacteroidia bacterium]
MFMTKNGYSMDATRILIEEIQKNIPKGENVVKYLTWKLGISKESAYRRMRGVVPFPLEEIRELALDLNFSVDEIFRKETPKVTDNQKNKNDILLTLITSYQTFSDIISRASQRSIVFSANGIILPLLIEYDALFDLCFFTQIHRNQLFNGVRSFSELPVSKEILAIRKNILDHFPSFTQREYILGRDLFSGIARKIQYFRRLKLISEKESEALKLELLQIIQKMETEMATGHNERGEECFYYFSWLDIENSAICVDCGDKLVTLCRCFGVPSLQTNSQSYANLEWVESQKKYTILISQSSEFIRSEFIERQRGFIEGINENKSFY